MNKCIKYALGFVFSDNLDSVLLIKKTKPEYLAGKLTGIGGKLNAGELPFRAMIRECKEETNLDIDNWVHFASMFSVTFNYEMFCFAAKTNDVFNFKKMEEEELFLVKMSEVGLLTKTSNCDWMLPMAINRLLGRSNKIYLIEES